MIVEAATKVKCPLCEGQGELTRPEIVERFRNKELLARIDARISEILEDSTALAASGVRDFHKEVHQWNPALPIWRRSPKE
jgi:hypothetical protein